MTNGALKHGMQAEVKDPVKQIEYGASVPSHFHFIQKVLLVRFLKETDPNTQL